MEKLVSERLCWGTDCFFLPALFMLQNSFNKICLLLTSCVIAESDIFLKYIQVFKAD